MNQLCKSLNSLLIIIKTYQNSYSTVLKFLLYKISFIRNTYLPKENITISKSEPKVEIFLQILL